MKKTKNTTTTLEGRYFVVSFEPTYHRFGKITAKINNSLYLITWGDDGDDDDTIPFNQELMNLHELVDQSYSVRVFDTIEERSKWLKWLNTPPKKSKPKSITAKNNIISLSDFKKKRKTNYSVPL